ncbi:MAG: hypothetical protein QM758_16570 [Armatimonas sp.]
MKTRRFLGICLGLGILELGLWWQQFRNPKCSIEACAQEFGITITPGAELIERRRIFWGGPEYYDHLMLRMSDQEAQKYFSNSEAGMQHYSCPKGYEDCLALRRKLAGNQTEVTFSMHW